MSTRLYAKSGVAVAGCGGVAMAGCGGVAMAGCGGVAMAGRGGVAMARRRAGIASLAGTGSPGDAPGP